MLAPYFEHCPRRSYKTNQLIISAGDQSRMMYYLVSGSVSVIMEDQSGHEIVLAYLNGGDFFGEMGMFDERSERSAWVRARSACEVAQVSYDKLNELSQQHPEVLIGMLKLLALRVRDTSRKLGDLAFKDVNGRIARTLIELCATDEAKQMEKGVGIDITRQELGRIVGCSREMASRVLKGMEERGLIEVLGKTILVLHPVPPEQNEPSP